MALNWLEVEHLLVVGVQMRDVSALNEATLLKQQLRGQVRPIGRDIELGFGAAALDLGKQPRTHAATAAAYAYDKQRYEPLIEERVVQYGKAENFVIVGGQDTFAAFKSGPN